MDTLDKKSPFPTEEQRQKFLEAIGEGAPVKYACAFAKWPVRFYGKIATQAEADRKEDRDTPYTAFMEQVESMRAGLLLDMLKDLRNPKKGQAYQAMTWLMQNLYKDAFGEQIGVGDNTVRVEITSGQDNTRIKELEDGLDARNKNA